MKYQIDDKVKVKPNLIVGKTYYMEDKTKHDSFTSDMAPFVGKTLSVTGTRNGKYRLSDSTDMNYTDEMLESFDRYELHITCFDGKTTNAMYKVNGKIEKRTEAKCSPSDVFDFAIGAQEAFDRAFPKAQPTQPIAPQEDKAKFAVGQKVKVTGNCCCHSYSRGTILTLVRSVNFLRREPDWYVGEGADYVSERDIEPYAEPEQPKSKYESMSNDELKRLACGISELCCPTLSNKKRKSDCPFYHTRCEVTNENRAEIIQYLISENTPEPEKEPEPVYYSGEVICVSEDSMYHTQGKKYVFKNGVVNSDEERQYNPKRPVKTLSGFNDGAIPQFIPYLGE